MPAKTVWVVTGNSESGDEFGPITFRNKPTQKVLKQLAYDWDGTEEQDGPGDYGSYVFLKVRETLIKQN
jgi:hypothetical protein